MNARLVVSSVLMLFSLGWVEVTCQVAVDLLPYRNGINEAGQELMGYSRAASDAAAEIISEFEDERRTPDLKSYHQMLAYDVIQPWIADGFSTSVLQASEAATWVVVALDIFYRRGRRG